MVMMISINIIITFLMCVLWDVREDEKRIPQKSCFFLFLNFFLQILLLFAFLVLFCLSLSLSSHVCCNLHVYVVYMKI